MLCLAENAALALIAEGNEASHVKKNDAAGITAARTEKARPFSRGQLLFGCRLSLESGSGGGGTENEGSR